VSKEELTPAAFAILGDGADGGKTSPGPTKIVSLRGPPLPVRARALGGFSVREGDISDA
jgi:hypothetical protein